MTEYENKIHKEVKLLATVIKSSIALADRELQEWRRRAEAAEKALLKAKENAMLAEAQETPKGPTNPRPEKREEEQRKKEQEKKKEKENKNEEEEKKKTEDRKKELKKKKNLRHRRKRSKGYALVIKVKDKTTYDSSAFKELVEKFLGEDVNLRALSQ
ncbi:putative autophagy-related protein 11, partial [Ochlerotatus camptorhynchus]|uniref:putative autophagy-related protein 11 n=1 Tax=Ochlerotatus camptorhynchus TaxID=644619 RepID=UPI0031E0A509